MRILMLVAPGRILATSEKSMTPVERLKALTRPMNQQELDAFLLKHYRALSRENVSSDETVLLPEDLVHLREVWAS